MKDVGGSLRVSRERSPRLISTRSPFRAVDAQVRAARGGRHRKLAARTDPWLRGSPRSCAALHTRHSVAGPMFVAITSAIAATGVVIGIVAVGRASARFGIAWILNVGIVSITSLASLLGLTPAGTSGLLGALVGGFAALVAAIAVEARRGVPYSRR